MTSETCFRLQSILLYFLFGCIYLDLQAYAHYSLSVIWNPKVCAQIKTSEPKLF